jgi:hypothetical protein
VVTFSSTRLAGRYIIEALTAVQNANVDLSSPITPRLARSSIESMLLTSVHLFLSS